MLKGINGYNEKISDKEDSGSHQIGQSILWNLSFILDCSGDI